MVNPRTPTGEALGKIDAVMAGYEASGLSRRQYCQREQIPVSTFDYYVRRRRQLRDRPQERRTSAKPQRLVRVKTEKQRPEPLAKEQAQQGFVLTLAGDRKIESGWNFQAQDLARLIRIVEVA